MGRTSKERQNWAGLWVALLVLLALLGLVGTMLLQANTVKLRRATVTLPDLPTGFEGTTILYVSDIDLCGTTTPEKSAEALLRLQALSPDMILLGGDYNSHTLTQILDGDRALNPEDVERRERFFHSLQALSAPLGKYALASVEDGEGMYATFEGNGFTCLNDSRQRITRNGDSLWLVGVTQQTENIRKGGKAFAGSECVIAVADSPECFPLLNTGEASDGGGWVDLCLAGHTHGGQILLFGRSMLELSSLERQYRYGWTTETGIPMLTTSGLGCEVVNLRLGTQPEVWLITLTRG